MSNALLCNESSNCVNEAPQDGLKNDSTILGDILSRKLLEANFEGKSVRAYTCTVSGKMKHMDTPDRFSIIQQHCSIINWSHAIIAAIIILSYIALLIEVSSQ